MLFEDHPPLMPRILPVPSSALSPISAVDMHETSQTSPEIVAEYRVDPTYAYSPTDCSSFNLLSPRLVALEVAVSDITLNSVPETTRQRDL